MAINREHARQRLKAFDFKSLFNDLGWDNLSTELVKQIDGADYRFHAVAEKRGVVVLCADGNLQAIFNGVDKDEVAEDVPLDGEQEAMAAALQSLE